VDRRRNSSWRSNNSDQELVGHVTSNHFGLIGFAAFVHVMHVTALS
jgi:hypothetical protein